MNNSLHLPGARSGVSTPGTPQLLVENEQYKEEDQPLYNALLRSLQSAMTAATAIDTGALLVFVPSGQTINNFCLPQRAEIDSPYQVQRSTESSAAT